MTIKNEIFKSIIAILISLFLGLTFCEILLRIKHQYVIDYDIEMWKYAKQLKIQIDNKKINHLHIKNKSAILQGVEIKINNLGQRDRDINNEYLNKFERRFLILGSSIALGWGVEENQVFSSRLNKLSKKNDLNWIFVNGGVGNYNTERYVNNYFENWKELEFTDIIINYFVNDSEILLTKKTNILIQHSHLAVVLWKYFNSLNEKFSNNNLYNYYENLYKDEFPGFINAKENIVRLNNFCKEKNINCYLFNMPDIHNLNPYKLDFINNKMKLFTNNISMNYYDLLDAFVGIDEKDVWNKYNDPHPNEYGHYLISQYIFEKLNL